MIRGWRDGGSLAESIDVASWGPRFDFQHLHGNSQSCLGIALEDLPFPGLWSYFTCMVPRYTKYIKIKENFKWLKNCNNLHASSLAVPPSSGIVSGTRQQECTPSSNAASKGPDFDNLCNYSLFQFHVLWYYWISYRDAAGPHKQV